MMLGGNNTTAANDVVVGNSGDAAAAITATTSTSTTSGAREGSSEAGLVGPINNSGDEEKGRVHHLVDEGDRTFGGNRWPRQETLALLKIRSDMDVTFRDASFKGPLWEEVSRKLAELGYNRSAKKCKEKFENVYKYHKRTKEGRSSKSDGKTYRFFDQLEALDNHPFSIQLQQVPQQTQKPSINSVMATTATTMAAISTVSQVTVPSTTAIPTMSPNNIVTTPTTINLTIPSFPPITNPSVNLPPPRTNPPSSNPPSSFPNVSTDLLSNFTSSSTSSDVELGGKRKRKRKWKEFFESLMKEVMEKQEELQKRFLEAIEKRERERMVREEAWRMQEMARINREREILDQQRSLAAAKDAAVMAFLQKVSEQQNQPQPQNNPSPPIPQQPQPQRPPAPAPQQPAPALPSPQLVKNLDTTKMNNGDQNFSSPPSSSRWPKVEVSALIRLRTNLDAKYQDNGPKGPLWEEISAGMRKIGYNRSSKRCKEKWENINKYFKKVKESNKKRPEDSKTCPYYHELDALYRERSKLDSSSNQIKPENSVPLMVQPEQQWPPTTTDHQRPDLIMEDVDHMDQNQEDDDNDDEEEEEGEDEGGGYEIVANKGVSMGTSE